MNVSASKSTTQSHLLTPKPALMEGSEAIALASIAAGCRFFAGYPMTPFTEVLEGMARLLPEVGGTCMNAESEIEVRKSLEVNPSNVLTLNAASSIFAFNGHPEEGAELADKSLRIDPRANSLSLNTLKDAYFLES